jgi:hypothetical protein
MEVPLYLHKSHNSSNKASLMVSVIDGTDSRNVKMFFLS